MGRYFVSLIGVVLATLGVFGLVAGALGQNGSGPQGGTIAYGAILLVAGAAVLLWYRRSKA